MIAALLLSLSLHHHGPARANRLTCYRLHRRTHCVKTPVWSAKGPAYGVWVKHEWRFIHHKWRRVTVTFPILHRSYYTVPMLITYYDNAGVMADGTWTYQGAAACGWDGPLARKSTFRVCRACSPATTG